MLELEEEIKRVPIELNLLAAKKRRSAQTGFVHLCYESQDQHDTIPLYENFCAVLALFRSRISEQVVEGKALLDRLLAFEVEGNFPVYLHDYPQAKDRCLSLHLLPVFHWMLTDFHAILGERLNTHLEALILRIIDHGRNIYRERPVPPSIWAKWKAIAEPQEDFEFCPTTAEEWGEYFIAWQVARARGRIKEGEWEQCTARWHVQLHTFLGPQLFEKLEPEVTLLDLAMGLSHQQFAERVKLDHPVHLQASLIQPLPLSTDKSPSTIAQVLDPYTLFWGNQRSTHSLQFAQGKSKTQVNLGPSGAEFVSVLSEEIPPEGEERMEVAFYCNLSPAHALFVNGIKASTFQLGDRVTIESEGMVIDLSFALDASEGTFFGHIYQGNRPSQKSAKGKHRFDAYDWVIGLRTVGRTEACALKATLTARSAVGSL
jgi:hypothetical protein